VNVCADRLFSSPQALIRFFFIFYPFVFRQSNLSTGAINLSMYTLYASAPVAMLVLSLYVTAVCAAAALLCAYRINTKFWA
jgi:hypothetical protein